jgi:heat shock protein HslJ
LRLAGGRSFCNSYGTAYELGPGGALRFRGFQSTLVGCYGPDSLETRFSRALSETRRIEIDSTQLSLVADNGSRLVFVLVTDSADASGR